MADAFDLFQSLDIHYVKTGYAPSPMDSSYHRHGQYMVAHHRKVLEEAAKRNIMVFTHEPVLMSGIGRTYPNFLAWEGVRGMEFNAWSMGNPPEHTTIVPFTRMLAGPVDYTPGIFDLDTKNTREKQVEPWKLKSDFDHPKVHTTLAKQLAYYVVLYSPVQMAADLPENYKQHPEAFSFIGQVPVNWQKSIVVNGVIGDYVTIARKNGNTWYVGSITDENARDLELPLSFLNTGKNYKATMYADGKDAHYDDNPTAYRITTEQVVSTDTLKLSLAPGGGQAIVIKPLGW